MSDLSSVISSVAQAPVLLVASDFDGTLADLADTPDRAVPNALAVETLIHLAELPQTFGAVISGRALADLALKFNKLGRLKLFGSHGAESSGRSPPLSAEQARTLSTLSEQAKELAERFAGTLIEFKPYSVALHYRGVERSQLPRLLQAIQTLGQRFPSVRQMPGIELAEFIVVNADKGESLKWLRLHCGAQRSVFLGDDFTDESAFAALGESDVGVKVGPGDSAAARRVDSPAQVATLLEELLSRRKDALTKRIGVPIHKHSILADQRTVALVTPDASVNWLCLPRLDSPAAFGALLGGESQGTFHIAPVQASAPARQSYVGDSLILRTSWAEADVTDYFDCGEGRPFQRAGRTDLIRVVAVRAPVKVIFAPRMDYARSAVTLVERDHGLELLDWVDPLSLHSPDVEWKLEQTAAGPLATAILAPRERPYVLELRYGTASFRSGPEEAVRRTRTATYWSAWAASLRLPSVAADAVKRSALTLRALMYGPSGAIAAAATTSLPAPIGGERNWDYRYCWPRDACLAAQALLRLGNTGMPMKMLDWLCALLDEVASPERLRPIYSLSGRELGSEATLPHMPGYLSSAPVRIGNAAAHQVQLDVFGPIVDTVAKVAESGAPVTPEHWRLAEAMAEAVVKRWAEPDHGIWEVRTAKRFHTHSRVMCWLALHRASTVAELVLGARRKDWDDLAARIRDETLTRAWNAERRAFVAHLDGTELDAAVLAMALFGFIEPRDERFVATVQAIQRDLVESNVVKRYLYDDGLPGIEGGFLLCTAWLIECLALMGRRDSAKQLFDAYLTLQGPTGLMAEQWDPVHGVAMGNFPQAYSHVGLINCACTLSVSPSPP